MLRGMILAAATTLAAAIGSLTIAASPAAAWYANQPYIRACHYDYWPYGYYHHHHYYSYGYGYGYGYGHYYWHAHYSYRHYRHYGYGPMVDCI